METLDNLFRESFKINKNIEVIERENTYHFKNVFKDVNAVLDFEKRLTKWESCAGAKPGMNSLDLPVWTANYIAHQIIPKDIYIIDEDDIEDSECNLEFIYFYYNNVPWNSDENKGLVSNNCLLPHTDPTYHCDSFIILFNLNQRPVSTCFWSYYGKKRVDSEEENNEVQEYTNAITYDNYEDKLNEGILKKEYCLTYNFNEAILYNANRLHSPVIDDYWTRENPRCMLRCFVNNYNYDEL
jgi:hypothetical protein